MGPPVVHEKFNSAGADIVIQSSDSIQFRLHRQNLEVTTGCLPGKKGDAIDGVLYLQEPAKTFETLFLFVYPQRCPVHLDDLDLGTLLDVSEAAEKYNVFFAISVCVTRLRSFMDTDALKVLKHALKHNHLDLADEIIPNVLFRDPAQTAAELPDKYVLPWFIYQSTCCREIFQKAEMTLQGLQDGQNICETKRAICVTCHTALAAWLWKLRHISSPQRLQVELENFHQYPDKHLELAKNFCFSACRNTRRCIYAAEIAQLCKSGLQKIQKFSEYLLHSKTQDGSG